MADNLREIILSGNEELRAVSRALDSISLAESTEDSIHTKKAYKALHAYQEDVPPEEVDFPDVEHPMDPDAVAQHYAQLRADLVEAKPGLESRQTELRERLLDHLAELLDRVSESGMTKKDQIIALKEALRDNFRGDLIAEVVDCSSSYPGKFRWNNDLGRVVLREGVEARRRNRFSDSQKSQIRRRDNQACANCGAESQLRVHHIIPIEAGGGGENKNGATLCKSCHDTIHQWGNGYGEDYESISEFWAWVADNDS